MMRNIRARLNVVLVTTVLLLLLLTEQARANWPIVSYTNGTVAVKSDNEVHIQTSKTQVNGQLNITGDLFVRNSNIAARIYKLEMQTPPICILPGGKGLFFDGTSWICKCAEYYFGTSCDIACQSNTTHYYNTTTSTCEENTASFITINGNTLYRDSEGWILLLAYNHNKGENNALVSGTVPISPFEGYSHIWLEDLGLTANDVDGVKFFCNTSAHARVIHFSMNNDWIKNAIITGSAVGNAVSYWTSGTTKFSDHTGFLPDATGSFYGTKFFEFPFYKVGSYHWAIGALDRGQYRWECDDFSGNTANTLHQIWFKQKNSSPPSSSVVAPIPSASWHTFVEECLEEEPINGECTTWASTNNHGTIPNWNTSLVTDMSGLSGSYVSQGFAEQAVFDGDISKWDVSKVTNMFGMFIRCSKFNQNISIWKTSAVTNMRSVFDRCPSFNQDVSSWDTSKVTTMWYMFYEASAFNQDISSWKGSAATSTQTGMLQYATAFQAKYSCTSTNNGPASSCNTIKSTWVAPSPPPPSAGTITDLDCSLTNGIGSYVTMNGKVVYSCNDYVLMLAYNHEANAAVVAKGYSDGTPPMTPTASNAHVLAQALGKSASDIESVKFFCNTTNHARILHFRTENEKIRSAMVNGVYNPGCSFSCSSAPDFATGYTLLQNHSARLPETTTRSHNTATSKNDFGIYYPMWNGGTCGHCPPAYAWHIAAFRGTGVDPVTDFSCDSERIGDTDATSHQIWVKFANV